LLAEKLNLLSRHDKIKSKLGRRQAHKQRSIRSVCFKTEILVIFTVISYRNRAVHNWCERALIVNAT